MKLPAWTFFLLSLAGPTSVCGHGNIQHPPTWFDKGGFESFIMIPATPQSVLKRDIETKLKKLGLFKKVKIVEKPGRKFIEVLKMNNKRPKKARCEETL